jgi:DNA-binding HxlR family transcriptional regulator
VTALLNALRRRRHLRRLADDWRVLWALRDGHEHFAYPKLRDATGLRSGRLYPTLTRLEQQGLVCTGWEDASVKLHPRRWYALTPEGLREMQVRRLEDE